MAKDRTVFLILLISFAIFSCKMDALPEEKDYPLIQTLPVSNIDTSGVTFNTKILNLGRDEIKAYGFVFDTREPNILDSDTVLIPHKAETGEFSTTVNHSIAANVTYNVKVFAQTLNHTVYGNRISFLSQGSLWNPWTIMEVEMYGWHDAHGVSAGEQGFILFQSGDFYTYTPATNGISKNKYIPIDGTTGTYFASFSIGKDLYILTNDSNAILKYETTNRDWIRLNPRPFRPNFYLGVVGFTLNNTGYFLSGNYFYSYNVLTDSWSENAPIPSNRVYTAATIENNVFVFAENKTIWKYSADSDNWTIETQFPGALKDKIIGFAIDDKIYFGLSYFNHTQYGEASQDFWQYSPDTKSWRKIAKFPLKHSQIEVFDFTIGKNAFIGYLDSRDGTDKKYKIGKFSKDKVSE